MTQRQLREVWNVTRIVAVALAMVIGTFVMTIEISGRFAVRGEEAKIVVRSVDRTMPGNAKVEEVSANTDSSAR